MQFHDTAPLSAYTKEELDHAAQTTGWIASAGQFTCRGPDGETAHGYVTAWHGNMSVGNSGRLLLGAVDPHSQQAAWLLETRRRYWRRVIVGDFYAYPTAEQIDAACQRIAILRQGVVVAVSEYPAAHPACDLLPRAKGVQVSPNWEIREHSVRFGAWVWYGLHPLTSRAREALREGRLRAVRELAPNADPVFALACVAAGERIRRGYNTEVLAQASTTPIDVWSQSMPRTNAAIPRWAASNGVTLLTGGVECLDAARQIAQAAAKTVSPDRHPVAEDGSRMVDGARVWSA